MPVVPQYEFSSNLNQALACVQRRRPELLLVGPSFGAYPLPKTKGWDGFVSDSRRLLHAHYVLALTNRHGGRSVEVWRRRDVTVSSTETR